MTTKQGLAVYKRALESTQKSVGYRWARSNESLLCMQPYHGGGDLRLATYVEEKMIFEIERLLSEKLSKDEKL